MLRLSGKVYCAASAVSRLSPPRLLCCPSAPSSPALGPALAERTFESGPTAGLEGALGQHRRRGGDSRDTALAAQ
jgi:hypothetical protein